MLSSLLEPVLVTWFYGAITENVYCLHYIKGSREDKNCNFLKDKKRGLRKLENKLTATLTIDEFSLEEAR